MEDEEPDQILRIGEFWLKFLLKLDNTQTNMKPKNQPH